MPYSTELSIALKAVSHAASICQRVQAKLTDAASHSKDDKSPVTVADYAAQASIISDIRASFSSDLVVGEEDASALRESGNESIRQAVLEAVQTVKPDMTQEEVEAAIDAGNHEGGPGERFWTLDPIDGTKGFLRGEQYAVALALIEDGEIVLGVLGCPNLPLSDEPGSPIGCLLSAEIEKGASIQALGSDEAFPIQVDQATDFSTARFCESVESGHSSHSDSAAIADQLGITREPYRIDSQCKYAIIARGGASVYLRLPTSADYEEKIWDHGAGVLIAEEAGGRVSDVHGLALDFSLGRTLARNKGVVVTNGALHDETIKAVQAVLRKKA
jgi:3'(2'), 5'-bisphosphate nucleotidase